MNISKPPSVTLNNYEYNSKWKPEDMVISLFKELVTVIQKVKQRDSV